MHTLENDTGPDDANHAQDGLAIAAGAGVGRAGFWTRTSWTLRRPCSSCSESSRPPACADEAWPASSLREPVVYVADALRDRSRRAATAPGAYGLRRSMSSRPARCASTRRSAPRRGRRPSTASMITGLYPHHHGYLHWDARLDPALPTLFTVAAAYGYQTASFVFDENYLFKGFPDANVAGTSERAGRRGRVAARASRPTRSASGSTAGRRTCRTTSSTPSARSGARRRRRSFPGIQSDRASRSRPCTRATGEAVERESETVFASFLERSTGSACGSRRRSSSSATTASRGASGSRTRPR